MKSARRLLYLFLILNALCFIWPLYWRFGLFIGSQTFGIIRFGLLSLLLLSAYKYSCGDPIYPREGSQRIHLQLFGGLVLALVIYGLARGNDLSALVRDTYIFVFLFCFLVIGRHDQAWEDLRKFLTVFFWIAFPFIIACLGIIDYEVVGGRIEEQESGASRLTNTLGFAFRTLIGFWPMVFLLAYHNRKMNIWKILGLLTIVAALALGVVFQYRARVLRIVAMLLMLFFVVPLLEKRLRVGMALLIVVMVGIAMAFIAGTTAFEGLVTRFTDTGGGGGRFGEAAAMFSDLNPVEYVVGRGMGGVYEPPPFWTAGVELIDDKLVRTTTHVGHAFPMLKGGLLFCLAYYAFYIFWFGPKPSGWHQSPYNSVAYVVVAVEGVLLFVLPHPYFGSEMRLLLLGMALSRLRLRPRSIPEVLPLYEPQVAGYGYQ
jgi:hypothetical protein